MALVRLPCRALTRSVSSVLWELRSAWGRGQRVALSLDARCQPRRLEGCVTHVAGTGAGVRVGRLYVPADAILAVHKPSRLGDSEWEEGERWHGRARAPQPMPGQLVIDYTRSGGG